MNADQIFLISLLGILVVFFVWERWRYDLVALAGLLVSTLLGFIPAHEAFLGFGHPAVVTVAAVLIISRGLSNAGAVEFFNPLYQGGGLLTHFPCGGVIFRGWSTFNTHE